jgi:hypothetical protein
VERCDPLTGSSVGLGRGGRQHVRGKGHEEHSRLHDEWLLNFFVTMNADLDADTPVSMTVLGLSIFMYRPSGRPETHCRGGLPKVLDIVAIKKNPFSRDQATATRLYPHILNRKAHVLQKQRIPRMEGDCGMHNDL